MKDWCIFCGAETEPARVCCPNCEPLKAQLTPEQLQALEKLQEDETAREELHDSCLELQAAIVEFVRPFAAALSRLLDVLAPYFKEEVNHGQD